MKLLKYLLSAILFVLLLEFCLFLVLKNKRGSGNKVDIQIQTAKDKAVSTTDSSSVSENGEDLTALLQSQLSSPDKIQTISKCYLGNSIDTKGFLIKGLFVDYSQNNNSLNVVCEGTELVIGINSDTHFYFIHNESQAVQAGGFPEVKKVTRDDLFSEAVKDTVLNVNIVEENNNLIAKSVSLHKQ